MFAFKPDVGEAFDEPVVVLTDAQMPELRFAELTEGAGVRALGDVGAIEVGVSSCGAGARISSGAVKCWGNNQFGSLGNRTNIDSNVAVSGLTLS